MPISAPGRRAVPLLLLALAASPAAWAARVPRVEVAGLDPAMTANVVQSLSLGDETGREVTDRRLDYLIGQIEPETRAALEPFGHYAPTVQVAREGDVVRVRVDPGPPVRVRREAVRVEGDAAADAPVQDEVAAFRPVVGEVLDHAVYEASKTRISRALAERGYFDADLAAHRVEVTRATQSADIDLRWTSGARYRMGTVEFDQTPRAVVDDTLLHKLVVWRPGAPYHQDRIERLRESLQRLDYFSAIDVQAHPDKAVDRRVPVDVTLTPAKRSVYTAGLSYGSDSGAGVRLGVDRRYLNRRGHKGTAQVEWAQRRKTLTLSYRIPAFARFDGWYTLAVQAADEQTDFIDNRRVELLASRSGRINRRLETVAGLHVLRERWAYAAEQRDRSLRPDYRYASFVFPQLDATYTDVDDRLMPRRGLGASAFVRGGRGRAGGDSGLLFAQVHASLSAYRGLGARSRLIARGELGHTWSDAPVGTLPPSLRFHAGGERSIRGYGWREVGPRIGAAGNRFAVGARNVVTGSVEYERYVDDRWGVAAFVDSGSAFNRRPDPHTGIGLGLRWRSPVGPVRIDVAHGLNSPDSPFQIYLGLGAEL